jgi:amidase
MKSASRDKTYDMHSRYNEPQFIVSPGEEFLAETELCTGGWLHSAGDEWSPDKSCALNPTVCVAVDGAMPGGMLAVRILDISVESVGYTGFDNEPDSLACRITRHAWPLTVKTVEIKDGFVHWSKDLKIPARPMIGTLGTAPAEEVTGNAFGGRHGGNMDVQEVRAGSTVYLPVCVPGAILHVGDVHAVQGDGEINCAGGVECRSVVRLAVENLPKPDGMMWPRIEDDDYIMAVACCGTVEESFHCAAGELLRWLVDGYGLPESEAYLLMGQVMEARCTQFVNPTRSYICKMAKKYLMKK